MTSACADDDGDPGSLGTARRLRRDAHYRRARGVRRRDAPDARAVQVTAVADRRTRRD